MSHVGNFAHANESHSGAGGVPSNENDPYTAPQRGRVMMIMDENGNATQVTLGEYHVESVHRNSGRTSDETAEAYIAPAHRQTMRKADTVRANIPAPFNNIKTGSDVSEDGEVGPPRAKSSGGTDIQFEHVEDECVLDADDAENDQYMRIAIPASKLKDVRKVKKDLYHDKPERQGSRLSNLTRAISLKGADRIRAAPATEVKSTSQSSKNSIARVGRMMSLPKQKRPSAVVEEQRNHSISDRPRGSPQGRSNGRSNPPGLIDGHPKPQMRRSISMVGRMLSKSRSKGGTVNMPAQGPSTNSINAPAADNVLQERPRASNDSDRMSERSSKAKPGGGVRAGLRQLGRTMSMNRSKPSEPQNQRQGSRKYSDSGSAGSGLSLDRQRSEENSKSNAGSSAPRKGLAQIGRTLSKLRPKASAVQTSSPQSSSTVSPCTDSSTDPFADSSPNSLGAVSVVSSAQSQTSSKGPDRDRDRESTRSTSGLAASSNASKKEATRKALKATGRALSFSRKPKQEGARKETKAEGLNSWSAAHVARANEKASACEGDGSAVIEPLTAEKLDGRANNFFFSDVNSEKIRACGLLGEDNTHIRVPVLVLGEYSGPVSRSRWFIDAFTLPHNAVRRECMDLYDILIAIAKQGPPGDVTSDDMRDFYDWWAVAREFFNCYFDVERKVMFPWVDAAGAEDWEVQLALRKMRGMKEKLKEQLDKVETAWAGRNERSPEETFVLVYKAVDAFAPKLMNYFADQEILLPAIVKGFYKIEDRLKMDKDMVAVFASGGDKNRDDAKHHVVLLARWITNPRQMRAWISKNLNASGRSMFPKWQEVFESEHHRIVKTFCHRIVVRDA